MFIATYFILNQTKEIFIFSLRNANTGIESVVYEMDATGTSRKTGLCMAPISDGNSEYAAHARRKNVFSGEKYPIWDLFRCNQMHPTDQIPVKDNVV